MTTIAGGVRCDRSRGRAARRYHVGAKEPLLALDLLARGWKMIYVDDLVVHHQPQTSGRVPERRSRVTMRNRLWTAWLRGLPWILRERRPVDARFEALLDALRHPPV